MLRSYLKHDVYKCFLMRYWYYLGFALFVSIVCFSYAKYSESPTYIDFILYIDKGNLIRNEVELNKIPIPYEWLIINIMIVFLPISYTYHELHSTDMIRFRSKKKWIINKFLFCIIEICILSMIKYMIPLLYSICGKCDLSMKLSESIRNVFPYVRYDISMTDIIENIFLLPLITLIAITFSAVLISLVVNDITAYIYVISVYIVAIVSESPKIIGNYLMLRRNGNLNFSTDPKFYHFMRPLCFVISITVISFFIGIIIIRLINPTKKTEI